MATGQAHTTTGRSCRPFKGNQLSSGQSLAWGMMQLLVYLMQQREQGRALNLFIRFVEATFLPKLQANTTITITKVTPGSINVANSVASKLTEAHSNAATAQQMRLQPCWNQLTAKCLSTEPPLLL
ncbi:hypothetical protein ABBQ38_000050 [Trebouxia sp. C0009 RCD-2024]